MRSAIIMLIFSSFFTISYCQQEINKSTIFIYSDPDRVKVEIPELNLKIKKDTLFYKTDNLNPGQYTIRLINKGVKLSAVLEISNPDTFIVYANFISAEIIAFTKQEYQEYIDNKSSEINQPPIRNDLTTDSSDVFSIVEDMPLFNGGDPATEFRIFICENLRYPIKAAEQGISGRVIVQFIVDENGKLINPAIIDSAHPLLDAEALRVINASPLWSPGKQKGKNVKVIYTFPIMFITK